jgi:predicted ATP-binding protein involved in virulence
MFIQRISVKNFRCFSDLDVALHESLNIIAARNGHGKTALLDALAIMLGTYIAAFPEGQGLSIRDDDVRLRRAASSLSALAQYPVELAMTLGSPQLHAVRQLTGRGAR